MRVIVESTDCAPLTARIIMGKVPFAVEFVVVRVRVDENGGLPVNVLKLKLTPDGALIKLSVSDCVAPLEMVTLIEKVVLCPGFIVRTLGEAEIWNR